MKGLISGIKRMEIHDGDGLRTTVFLKGCPLKCIWCHNPESIAFEKQVAFFTQKCVKCGMCQNEKNEKTAEHCPVGAIEVFGKEYDVDTLVEILRQDAPFFKRSGGGVTISGGECLAQPEFATALAKRLWELGISVYIDTCGFVKQTVLDGILPYVDKFLYDIKAVDRDVHIACTGKSNEIILDNLKHLCGMGCQVEIRYPLVVGYNDLECEKIAKLLSPLPGITKVKVLRYHAFSASRYEALGMKNTLPDTQTTFADMEQAVAVFKGYGLQAVNGMVAD